MKKVYEMYQQLLSHTNRSYWEKRILAEIGYVLDLFSVEDEAEWALIRQAVELLSEDYRENEQLQTSVAKEAEALLAPLSEKAKSITMICAAHAHIDMNWMWGFQETVAVTLDTVRTMLTLMKEYPSFTFSQSQASVYHILEEYAPELLAQVKQRVQEGRWEVTASSWVENDKNMSGGEAMARHLLYTKQYLSKLLDIKEESLNLDFEPDTFGHSANLPEILRNGGVSRYYHCRAFEGENIYRWRGMSGAEVLVYREPRWYNATIDSSLGENVPVFCKKYGIDKVLFVYGVGDHGGGPTRRDIDRLIDMSTWPLFPSIRFGTFKEYYDYLEERKDQFSVVEQELNYVFTGCYTSQSRIKKANRIGEARLMEAELLETMAKLSVPDYQPFSNMEEAWRKVLFNQFHDILPGSGTVETREYAMGEFQRALARAGANGMRAMDAICSHILDNNGKPTQDMAMGAGVGMGTDMTGGFGFSLTERGSGSTRYLALFNVTQAVRTDPTEMIVWDWQDDPERMYVTDLNGEEYPFQVLEKGTAYWGHTFCKLLVWIPVPALGYIICRLESKQPDSNPYHRSFEDPRLDRITDEPIYLENDKVKAAFDACTMKCISFIRKEDGKELIVPGKPACGLHLVTEETSQGMTAWRVGKTSDTVDLNETCRVVPGKTETQGLRKTLEYELGRENLKVHVEICLDEGNEFLDYRIKTVWPLLGSEEKGVPQLRFSVPCGYEAEHYRYTIPYGTIDRGALAQDVPAVGIACALPKDGGSGLYLLSDSKYGFRGDADGLSLNLIRGSYNPDPYPEVGDHLVRVAVGACDPGEHNLALIVERYLHPVIVRSCGGSVRMDAATGSIFGLEGAVLSAIKAAEDGNGYVIRVYNPSKGQSTMKLCLPGRKVEAHRCDFLENEIEAVPAEDDMIVCTLGGYEVASFRVLAG